jgi:hypothetical protein
MWPILPATSHPPRLRSGGFVMTTSGVVLSVLDAHQIRVLKLLDVVWRR